MAKAWDILKMGVIGTVFIVDGKKYHFNPDDVERYKQVYRETMGSDPQQKKRIALRNVIRERGIQPKVR